MAIYRVPEASWPELLALSESGMGFQLVRIVNILAESEYHLVLASGVMVQIGGRDAEDRWLRGRAARDWFFDWRAADRFEERSFRRPELLIRRADSSVRHAPGDIAESAQPGRSALVKHTVTAAGERYYRFSCTSSDRRVDPKTGDWLPGTYGTTTTDHPLAPSGFAAVGRYALPNDQPASLVYTIAPAPGTPIQIGTVAPAYGQAGGGVEIYFPEGAKHEGEYAGPLRLPDE